MYDKDKGFGAPLFWVIAVCALLVATLCASPVFSQRVHPPELTPQLALARLCVNESGLRAHRYGDCAAIHAVIEWRRAHVPAYRGLTYVEALHYYSDGVVVDRTRTRRRWILDLWPDARPPRDYCETCRWTGRGDMQWIRTYVHAARVYRGEVSAECYGQTADGAPTLRAPHTWARSDVAPDEPSAALDCPDTVNTLYTVTRYLERWPDA